jgi:hypothetical protein
MLLIDDPVWGIIIITSISNFLVDVFGEVLLEYGVYYTRGYIHDFSMPGFEGFAAVPGGETATPVLINGVAPSPEQVELLHSLLATFQAAQ